MNGTFLLPVSFLYKALLICLDPFPNSKRIKSGNFYFGLINFISATSYSNFAPLKTGLKLEIGFYKKSPLHFIEKSIFSTSFCCYPCWLYGYSRQTDPVE
jgi:hypothetical protein